MQKTTLPDAIRPLRRRASICVFILCALMLLLSTSAVLAGGSFWKVGQGVIYGAKAGGGLSLRISLRNNGAPSSDTVRIMGRWTRSGPGKTVISGNELSSFVELGLFSREVKMKQTAILNMALGRLGAKPVGVRAVEVAVITANTITDGVVILNDQ